MKDHNLVKGKDILIVDNTYFNYSESDVAEKLEYFEFYSLALPLRQRCDQSTTLIRGFSP